MKNLQNKPNKKVQQLKAQFSNATHKIISPNYNMTIAERRKLGVVRFTNEQKIEMFDKIMQLHNEISSRISYTRYDKRAAKRKYLAMVAEGKTPKQKTTLTQWIQMQKEKEVVA